MGLKATLIVQLVPAASELPHVLLVIVKSPMVTMLVMVSGADRPFRGLVRVTFWGLLDVPTVWFPKVRLVGDSWSEGAVTAGPVNVNV